MSIGMDAVLYPSARLTLRETALWGAAATTVVATHLLAVYMYYASAPEAPAAEAMEQALTIDLATLSVSEPASVAAEAAPPAEEPDTIQPVEETVPLARETVEPIRPTASIEPLESVQPDQAQVLTPSEQTPLEAEPLAEAEPLDETEPIAPAQLAALSPEEVEPSPVTPDEIVPSEPDQVVLPESDVPIPTPRPQPPARTVVKETKPAPAREARKETPTRQARAEPAAREKRKEPAARREASSATASAQGGTSTAPRIDPARWQTKVVAWLNRHKRYPSSARSRREEGTANVTFTIDSSGRVLSARIARSSGSQLLDQAALEMVQRSSPVPPPPPQIARSSITLGVPVNFQMR